MAQRGWAAVGAGSRCAAGGGGSGPVPAAVFAHVRPGRAAAGAARRGRAWGAAAVVQVREARGGIAPVWSWAARQHPHRAPCMSLGARRVHPWRCRDGWAWQGRAERQGPSSACAAGLGGDL